MQKKQWGFTLIELMVTLAIIAIVVMIGAPSFNNLIARTRMTASINEFVTALNVARNEAVKRNVTVTLRKSDNKSSSKNGTNWEDGWDLFVDINGNGIFEDNGTDPICETPNSKDKTLPDSPNLEDCLLKTHQALLKGYTLRGNSNSTVNYVLYKSNGTIKQGTIGSFYLCNDANANGIGDLETAKVVVLDSIGRPRMGIDKNKNGIVENGSGDITTCLP
jgi:type IV fimbrial biogenesis protein FimT